MYPDGCSVYFTFAAKTGRLESDEALYFELWDRALEVARDHGATISHHHGIGMLKADALRAELGPLHDALRVLKRGFDPDGILNPGKLGL